MGDYEPGLGCPAKGCRKAFYTPDERRAHIVAKHPGEYAGPTDEMLYVMHRAGQSPNDLFSDRRQRQVVEGIEGRNK